MKYIITLLIFFLTPVLAYSQTNAVYYTADINNSYVINEEEVGDKYSSKIEYKGKIPDLIQQLEIIVGTVNINPVKNYNDAMQGVSLKANSIFDTTYSDIIAGVFYNSENIDIIEYIFPPFHKDELLLVKYSKKSKEKSISTGILTYLFKNKKSYIASGICLTCIFPDIKKKGGAFYKGGLLKTEDLNDISKAEELLKKNKNSLLLVNKSKYEAYYKDSKTLTVLNVLNEKGSRIKLPMFVAINKASHLIDQKNMKNKISETIQNYNKK